MPQKTIFLSNETIIAVSEEEAAAVKKYAKHFNLEEALIRAFIKHESMEYSYAYRIDYSVLKNQAWYLKTLSAEEKKGKANYASYGLMQVLYGLAKSYGFKGKPIELFDIDTNIYYGCKHLDYLRKRYHGKLLDMIHAYNWGSNAWMDLNKDGIKNPGEPYRNQEYVDSVYTKYQKLGGKKI